MQYLVIFTPNKKFEAEGPPADFAEVELRERAQARALYALGGARQVWAQVPRSDGAVVLFEADSPDHLQQMIDSFPLLQVGYATPRVIALQPHAAFMPPEETDS